MENKESITIEEHFTAKILSDFFDKLPELKYGFRTLG